MRFQQLKRDPNSIMRKKLVKSKKNWIVVSSLSIAGGLFLLTAPSYVAKADATTAAVKTEQTAPSGTETTSLPNNSSSTESASNNSSKEQTVTTPSSTTTTDKTKNSAVDTTIQNTDTTSDTPTTPSDSKTTDTSGITALAISTTPRVANSTATQSPIANSADTTDGSGTNTLTANGSSKNASATITDGSTATQSDTISTDTTDKTVTTAPATADTTTQAQPVAAVAAIAPVAEAATVTTNSGNGWSVDDTGTTLTITGALDEGNGTYQEHWGGNTDTITTVNINNAITAPTDSSYLFANMTNLTSINGLSNFDTTNVTNSEGMFKNDSKLTNLNLSSYTFKSATNISHMFENDTALQTVTFPAKAFMNIVDGSYAFANDTSLTDIVGPTAGISGTNSWVTYNASDLRAMFKNDSKLTSLNLYTWDWTDSSSLGQGKRPQSEWPETGDSSIGEGMFDGTNLSTITLNGRLYFNPKTALTSSQGTTWTSAGNEHTFSGIPTFDSNGNVTGGLGYLYNGTTVVSGGTMARLVYNATGAVTSGPVTNLITVHTNHGDITVEASGTYGQSSSVTIPSTMTIDGVQYTTTTPSVTATFGQTTATADQTVTYASIPVAAGSISIPTSNGGSITISVPAGNAGGTTTVTVPTDQIPAGYTLADGTNPITITYNDSTTTPFTANTTEIKLVGNPVASSTKDIVTSQGTQTIDIPAGTVGTTVSVTLPTVTGYDSPTVDVTYNADGTTTVTDPTSKNEISTDNPAVYTGQPVSASTKVISTSQGDQTLDIPAGTVGTTVTVTLPTVTGYDSPTVDVTYNADGTTTVTDPTSKNEISTDNPAVYTGQSVSASTKVISTSQGDQTLNIPAGTIGTTVSVTLPDVKGYAAPTVNVTYNADGTTTVTDPTSKDEIGTTNPAVYVGDPVSESTVTVDSSLGSKQITIPAGNVGDTKTVTLPTETGYTAPNVTVTYNADGTTTLTDASGKTISTDNPATYTGDPVAASSATVSSNKGNQTVTIPAGNVGDTKTVTLPTETGYVAPTITVIYNTDGTTTLTDANGKVVNADNPATYVGNPVAASSATVSSNKGDQSITIPAGNVGDTKTVTLPTETGYTAPTITVTYNTDGTTTLTDADGKAISTDNPATYVGNPVASSSAIVSSNKGDQSITIPAGNVGDTKTVTLPTETGYTAPTVTVTYNPDGTTTLTDADGKTISTDNPATYTGNPVAALAKSVPSNQGNQSINIPAGNVGDTKTITFPTETGYTAPTVTVTYNPDGTTTLTDVNGKVVDADNPAIYVGNPVNASTSTVPSNKGDQSIDIPAGNVGDTKTVTLPTETGYTAPTVTVTYNSDGTTTLTDANGKVVNADNPVTYVGDPVAASSATVSSNKGDQSISIPAGNIGDTKTITFPTETGYTAPTVTVTYNSDGTTTLTDANGKVVNADNPATYVGNPVAASSATVSSNKGNQSITIPAGNVGDTKTITLPAENGYVAPTVTVTYNPDGTTTLTDTNGKVVNTDNPATYVGNPIASSSTIVSSNKGDQSITIPAGNVGDTKTVTLPTETGYTAPTVTVTYNPDGTTTLTDADGKTISTDNPASYVGDPIASSATTVPSNEGNQTITIPAGNVGDTKTVTLPAETGYTAPTVTVTYNPDGTTTLTDANGKVVNADNPVTYVGDPVAASTSTVPSNKGDQSIDIPAGNVGDTKTVTLPAETGYTAPTVTVTYNSDGTTTLTDKNGKTISNDNPATYVGNSIQSSTSTVPSSLGNQTIDIPTGTVGETKQVTLPTENGYTAPTVNVTYNPDGTTTLTDPTTGNEITDSNAAVYVGNPVASTTTTVPSSQGDQDITIPAGAVGDTKQITLPTIDGYTAPTVTVTYNPDGTTTLTDADGKTISADNTANYVGTPNKATTVTVKNPDGTTTSLDIPAGNYGDKPVTITAQAISGYTAPAIIVTYGIDGTPTITSATDPTKKITNTDELTYTRKSSGGSGTVAPEEGTIEHKIQTIATYADKPAVDLYQLGSDNKMTLVSNRALATASDWYSDEIMTIGGVSYYRVATNEWTKISQVYPYQSLNLHIRTYDDSEKALYKAENIVISNETLAPDSSWITDRETYVINNTKYYRVATNEFVNADDVYVYSPVNMVVTTHADKYTTLYTAKGSEVTNRTLSNNTSWKVDSVTYINGDKYYRVATNEFVKASDVDIKNYR